jgi:hypothetical protein
MKNTKIAFIFTVIFLIGCSSGKIISKTELAPHTEIIEKRINGDTRYYINYSWSEKQYLAYFDPNLTECLTWLHNNLQPTDKVFSWWDYGGMIRGFSNVDAVLYGASADIPSIDKELSYEIAPSATIRDVSRAFLTEDHKELLDIMNKYNARYLLIPSYMDSKTIARIADRNITDNSILTRGIRKGEIPGFLVAYQDNASMLYVIR